MPVVVTDIDYSDSCYGNAEIATTTKVSAFMPTMHGQSEIQINSEQRYKSTAYSVFVPQSMS